MSGVHSLYKKINLSILFATVITVSIEKGLLLLISTYYYYLTMVPWYEWLNYVFLGVGTMVLPVFCLFFLRSVHIRRFLRFYLFGMMFTLTFVLIEDSLVYLKTLWAYERPFNSILVILEFSSLSYCWLFLTRQFRGKSLLPIAIRNDDHYWTFGFKQRIIFPFISLLSLIRKSPVNRKRIVNIAVVLNLIVFSGLVLTMIPENRAIELDRPLDHDMKISYW